MNTLALIRAKILKAKRLEEAQLVGLNRTVLPIF